MVLARTRRSPPMREIPTLAEAPALQLMSWLTDPASMLERGRHRLGPVFRLRIAGWADLVIVADVDLLAAGLADEAGRLETGAANAMMTPLVGERSVFVNDGSSHRSIRRTLAPLFAAEPRRAIEGQLLPILQQGLRQAIDRGSRHLNTEDILRRAACRATWQVICGRDVEEAEALAAPLAQALGPLAAIGAFAGKPVRRLVTRPIWLAVARLEQAIFDEIDRQASRQVAPGGLIGAVGASDDLSAAPVRGWIRDNAISLLAAGGDTTASAGAWVTALCLDPEDPAWASIRRALESDDQAYLQAAAHEALRLGPVVEVVSRRAVEPFTLGDYSVRAGDLVSPCPYLVHRDPSIYPDPNLFKPARFLDSMPPPHLYFPFGGGARRCLGAPLAISILTTWMRTLGESELCGQTRTGGLRPRRRNVTLSPRSAGRLRSRPEHT